MEERVVLALWRLPTGNSYRSCGLQFGFGKSTAKLICSEFEQAIFELKERFIKKNPLKNQEIREKIEELEERLFAECVLIVNNSARKDGLN